MHKLKKRLPNLNEQGLLNINDENTFRLRSTFHGMQQLTKKHHSINLILTSKHIIVDCNDDYTIKQNLSIKQYGFKQRIILLKFDVLTMASQDDSWNDMATSKQSLVAIPSTYAASS